ncbi:SAC3 family protein 1 [Tolypocladium ophioglossoides CBS 100239]|uniref:SAC3 family protein 1 n=1 Tax=Tolypocladium ophioglossoides (strain CBS 100239) TaxID=1163406 RepID=A0A0L0NIQ4_TOLOC|nr:SAC3 family protein 1 [Tolypocladium ophioglossoides CBS 100239]
MFSTLGEATRRSASAANPFASRVAGENRAFGLDGAGDGGGRTAFSFNKGNRKNRDRRGSASNNNPKNANAVDGGKHKSKRGRGEKREHNGDKRSRRRNDRRGSLPEDSNDSNALRRSYSSDGSSLPNSWSPRSPTCDPPTGVPQNYIAPTFFPPRFRPKKPTASDDLYAKRIYKALDEAGISPPQWPSNPGEQSSLPEMSGFKDKFRAYRDKARAALIKAKLIDDPDKRKRLSEAIEFKGICDDMCPEWEKVCRITENEVKAVERNPKTGATRLNTMVKQLARSAAGQEAPLPTDVRTVPALQRSLDYLIDGLFYCDDNMRGLHAYVWDRTRSIRRDFAFHSTMTKEELRTQVLIFENIARFHAASLHLMSLLAQPGDGFSESFEHEQLGKTLLSLRDLYDDCNLQDIKCENEAEFRAYFLLFHGRDPAIVDTLQRNWKPYLWRDSDEIKTAVSLVEAMHNTQDIHGSLKTVEDKKWSGPLMAAETTPVSYLDMVEDARVSYTMACIAECHFGHVRQMILEAVQRSLSRPKGEVQDMTAAALNELLRFDCVEEAILFTEAHGFEFALCHDDLEDVGLRTLKLKAKSRLRYPKLGHQYSKRLVENKRGNNCIATAIRRTLFEGVDGVEHSTGPVGDEESEAVDGMEHPPYSVGDEDAIDEEGSLFMQDEEPEPEPSAPVPTSVEPQKLAAEGPSAPSPGSRKVSPSNKAFIIEEDSDDEEDGPNVKPRARLPTFEEIKAMDNSSFYTQGSRLFTPGGASSNSSQPAKPNIFASPLKLPDAVLAHNAAGGTPAKSNPFAPPSLPSGSGTQSTHNKSENSTAAKTNPFAGPVKLGGGGVVSGANRLGNSVPAKPDASNSILQPGSSQATANQQPSLGFAQPGGGPATTNGTPSFGLAQPRRSPFATLPLPASNAATTSTPSMLATPAAQTPSVLSGILRGNKPSEPVAPPVPTQTTFLAPHAAFRTASNEQKKPLLNSSSLPQPTVDGRGKDSIPSLTAAPSAPTLSPSTPGILGMAKPSALGIPQSTTGAIEKPSMPGALGAVPQPTAVSGSTSDGFGSKLNGAAAAPAATSTLEAVQEPVGPPRDLLGDFNEWYVKGDNGLMSDFLVESIKWITNDAFQKFSREIEEKKRQEEEERTNAEVKKFRVYNLSLKFFYRWKRNARAKRLREVRRKGRDEMRAFYAARQVAERKAKKEGVSVTTAVPNGQPTHTTPNRSDEFLSMMKSWRSSKRDARQSLLDSGVLSGMDGEREAVEMIVGDGCQSSNSSPSARRDSLASSSGPPAPVKKEGAKTRALRKFYFGHPPPDPTPAYLKKEGPKTRALRQMYFGQPERFRRSLPSMSSASRDSPESTKHSSNASSRWTLKAMGIVQLPDGTAVPENLAHEMASGTLRYPRSVSPWRSRRLSAAQAIESEVQRLTPAREGLSLSPAGEMTPVNKRKRSTEDEEGAINTGNTESNSSKRVMSETERQRMVAAGETSPTNKRKRCVDDDKAAMNGTEESSSHKRMMSNAAKLRLELQAIKAELEEGKEWYKAQNDRLRSESEARTPWYDESI